MNIALVLAGGSGVRAGQKVPKQFLTIYDTPIIVYTLKNIENSGCFDAIYAVCSEGWKSFVESYAEQYDILTFKGTITGGKTRQESFYNGIQFLTERYNPDDIIFMTDGNRPLIPKRVFEDSIEKALSCDCVLPLEPCYDSMYQANAENQKVIQSVNREELFRGQAPETAKLSVIKEICDKAVHDALKDQTLTSLMLHYGMNVAFIPGSSKCFKITTADDFSIFKALLGEDRIKSIK